jgi:uncharacterized protein
MPIPKELLDILVCPITHQPLKEADSERMQTIIQDLTKGHIRTRGTVDWKADQITGMLITTSEDLAYPVIEEIPNLLPSSCILISEA